MKTSRFSEPQILAILRQAEGGVPVPELCREHGMSTASFYICGRLSRCKRSEQVSGRLGCQHLSGVARDAGAPKWVIRAA
jgi:hypothetical protein